MKRTTALAAILAAASPAFGHDRSASYSDWEVHGGEARVRFRVTKLDASLLASEATLEETPAEYFSRRLELSAGGVPCPSVGPPTELSAAPEELVFEWRVRCASAGAMVLTSRILAIAAPGHLHFARLRRDGMPPRDHLLTRDTPDWPFEAGEGAEAAPPVGLGGAVGLGIVHVASGADHVAFLAALLLGSTALAEVLAIVSAFTVAHSLTLALATLGAIVPEPAVIEALIGLSIALVAVENLAAGGTAAAARIVAVALGSLALAAALGIGRVPGLTLAGLACFAPATLRLVARGRHRALLRAAIAFLFGLVHGFGFASVLAEARLEGTRLALALLGFNVGVEIGQISIVGALAAALALAARSGHAARARTAGSIALLAAGVAWFVGRAYG